MVNDCENCASERAGRERAEGLALRYLTERDDWFMAYQRADAAFVAEREAHEETQRRHAETLAAVSDRLSLLGRCDRAESRLAAALDDRAFLLELLGITVKTGTKDPLLDARLAEARAFLAGGKTK